MGWPVFCKGWAKKMSARIKLEPNGGAQISPSPIQVRAEPTHFDLFELFLKIIIII